MTTGKMAIALPIFNRQIKNFVQISNIVRTIILHPHFGFLLVQTKNNENHEFSHFFPEFIALSRKMNLTENNSKSNSNPKSTVHFVLAKVIKKILFAWHS